MSALSSVEVWDAAIDDGHQPKGSNTSDHCESGQPKFQLNYPGTGAIPPLVFAGDEIQSF